MINRIIDISQSPARLSVKHSNLIIAPKGQPPTTLPLSDVAVLVISHPQVRISQPALSGLAEAGGVLITCNAQRLPNGMLLPLKAHSTQVERFAAQANAKAPLKKRAWQQIVRAKIRSQARLLKELHGDDCHLLTLVSLVKSGDPSNVEARAARRYWQHLFADASFRRDRNRDDQNSLLNYGYAVLRAIVARAICAAGLHPSLGVHHHNRYSTYCLADDLMEPLRPAVDAAVVEIINQQGITALGPESKGSIIEVLMARYELEKEERSLFDIAARMATSLAEMFLGKGQKLTLPSI